MSVEVSQIDGQLDAVLYNAITGSADHCSQFTRSAGLAEEFGYQPDSPHVQLKSGENAGDEYIPGIVRYTGEDHIRGLSGLVLDAPELEPEQKSRLLQAIVRTVETVGYETQSYTAAQTRNVSGVSRRKAQAAVTQEVNQRLAETNVVLPNASIDSVKKACQLFETKEVLQEAWHPHRRTAVIAGIGLAGVVGAVSAIARRYATR